MNDLELKQKLPYHFQNPSLLETALTHSSYRHDGRTDARVDNERLEFLGDAIFDLVISEYLYLKMQDVEEGQLSKLRALVVCEQSLAECGMRLGINHQIRLGRGEENNGGRTRPSIIADAVEAIIASIYLDGGLVAARDFILQVFEGTLRDALSGKIHVDFKTELQERLQEKGETVLSYQLEREEGPDHNKTFFISLWVDGKKVGEGQGHSKKEAEQQAAKVALEEYEGVF